MLVPNTLLQQRYLIVRPVGKGGMGAVYQATDTRLNCTVALKQTLLTDKGTRKAFEREAQLLARLRHPTLPKVSDHFVEASGQFLVMEFIPGDDLAGLLARNGGKFPSGDVLVWVLRWADQLLDALDYLHTQTPQIIHQDIKPQNLKLTPRGDIILLDFGLAKGVLPNMETVMADSSVGIGGFTPNYAPLEQIRGAPPDPRSDLYSLAATLYHLLTGVRPPDALSRAAARLGDQPDPLRTASDLNPQIPAPVVAILHRALSLNIDERPATAATMREVIHAVRGDSQPIIVVPNGMSGSNILLPVSGTTFVGTQRMELAGATIGRSTAIMPISQPNLPPPPTTPPVGTLLHTLAVGTPVLAVTFSPNAPLIAVAGEDRTVSVWQVTADSPIYTLEEHTGSVRSIAFSPDGQLLASGGDDEVVRLWWVDRGSLATAQEAWASHAECVAFSPDGKMLASGGWGGIICLWRVDHKGRLVKDMTISSGFVHSLAFSPDGKLLAAGCYDGAIRLWQASDGLLVRTLKGYSNFVLSIAFSPDGQWLAAGGGNSAIRMWRIRDGRLIHTLEGHSNFVHSVAFRPDGRILASGSEDKTVRLWRVNDGTLVNTYTEQLGGVTSVAFSRDGQMLAAASRDTKIRLRQAV